MSRPCPLQATPAEVRMLVNEYNLATAASRANWVLLSIVNRAFKHEYCLKDITRSALVDLEASGVGALARINMAIPNRIAPRVRQCLAG